MAVWTATLIGLAVGVGGTGAGGLYIFFIKDVRTHRMNSILGFSGGIMLVAVFLELLPEALAISGLIFTMIGIIMGVIFLTATEDFIEYAGRIRYKSQANFHRAGSLLFLAIASHNFPEGLAIGGSYAASISLGILLALAIAVHNIPEGLAVAAAFRLSGVTSARSFLYAALAGIPMGLGTLLGQALGEVSPLLITVSLGFAAGAMLYTTCEEILPDIFMAEDATPGGFFWGLIVGIILFNIF
ncbi:MAG: ZIP family metal transporter [Tepidanaerobacteraceae bacterium]|jgi:ZIP family zinc transporter|nr:ZIP family metal transporter [Tepidanaerobacteraceae bacterium]